MSPKTKKLKMVDQPDQNSAGMKLRIGNIVVSVDKDALIAESAYFATMFTGNFKESDSTSIELQQPDNVCLKTLIKLVKSLGQNNSKLSVERKDAVKVWMAAKYLQVEKAEKMAADILEDVLKRPENAYRMWRLASRRGLPDLETLAVGKIFKSYLRGAQFAQLPMPCQKEFLQCSAEEVTDLLTHDDFVPQSEAMVYQIIMRWCIYDGDDDATERIQNAYQLLSGCVVWNDLDMDLLTASASGQLHEALTRISEDRKRGQMGGGALLKRAAKKEAIFYHMREGHPHQLLRFDFVSNELAKLDAPLQAALAECWPQIKADGFAVSVGTELIVVNKSNSETWRDSDLLVAIDCITGSRRTLLKGLPLGECICAVSVGSQLYVASSKHWYCFDVASGHLRYASKLPYHRTYARYGDGILLYSRASMEAFPIGRDMIFFSSVGSVDAKHDYNPESVVEMYDIRSNKWEKRSGWNDEKLFHHSCGTIVFQGYMYITGGRVDAGGFSWGWETSSQAVAACHRVALNDPYKDPESIANLNIARYQHCIFIKDGQIWVYGGTTHVDGDNQRKRALMSFERYSADTNQWNLIDVPMTKELQAEVAGGNCAQKTVCLPLQHQGPAVCEVAYNFKKGYFEGEANGYDVDVQHEDGSGTDEDDLENGDNSRNTVWPAGLDD